MPRACATCMSARWPTCRREGPSATGRATSTSGSTTPSGRSWWPRTWAVRGRCTAPRSRCCRMRLSPSRNSGCWPPSWRCGRATCLPPAKSWAPPWACAPSPSCSKRTLSWSWHWATLGVLARCTKSLSSGAPLPAGHGPGLPTWRRPWGRRNGRGPCTSWPSGRRVRARGGRWVQERQGCQDRGWHAHPAHPSTHATDDSSVPQSLPARSGCARGAVEGVHRLRGVRA